MNVFNKNVLNGNGGDPEIVAATVVKGNVGDAIKYKIKFTVYNNGVKRPGTFQIDPKVRVK